MKLTTFAILSFRGQALSATLLKRECGVPPGAHCDIVGRIRCEFNGGHMIHLEECIALLMILGRTARTALRLVNLAFARRALALFEHSTQL
ncbi:hypothetical protein CTAM01_16402 [Colletotrichum tamarilloi]|uniref:Secreted protein n=1 Tax=Colletotrichum tamarilloi TaxID=1209934 RepID=A0ABQ9QIK7_9PEZI|nr:uncharacterized protein CTAM01_16402 [Colletotrichum tamarilloi]KAK1471841.1 hypothetical protein CTAM01_16402 [Colletotrichum tamarilloi]